MKKISAVAIVFIFITLLTFPLWKVHAPQRFHDFKKYLKDSTELYLALWQAKKFDAPAQTVNPPFLVAHAGGGIYNLPYTNSLEALEQSYTQGFRWIELDAILTSDDKLVMLHDWRSGLRGLFNEKEGIRTAKEFKNFSMVKNLTQLDFNQAAEWFTIHTDAYLVLDNKSDLERTLKILDKDYPHLKQRTIVSINRFREYAVARKLGFELINFSLYVPEYGLTYSDETVLKFSKAVPLVAVTLPAHRAALNLPHEMQKLGIFTYAFTIDDPLQLEQLHANEVDGFYTNFLPYSSSSVRSINFN